MAPHFARLLREIGQELPDAKAVPVVIKSLIFRHTEHGRGHQHQPHH